MSCSSLPFWRFRVAPVAAAADWPQTSSDHHQLVVLALPTTNYLLPTALPIALTDLCAISQAVAMGASAAQGYKREECGAEMGYMELRTGNSKLGTWNSANDMPAKCSRA